MATLGSETESPGSAGARGERALVALSALLVVLLSSQLLDFGYGRDQALYSLVADALLRGEVPYRDAWDFKPPGIYFVYAAARSLFGPNVHAVRLLETLGLLSLIPAFAILSRRHIGTPRAGAVAAAIAFLAYVPLEFWYTGQPEGFGAVLLAWALVCADYEAPVELGSSGVRRERCAWVAAAALYAAAALLKPPLGGGILVSFLFVLRSRRRRYPGRSVGSIFTAPTAAFLVGAALPLFATGAYFIAAGAWNDLVEALFRFAPRYTALGLDTTPPPELIAETLYGWLLRSAPFNLVGLVALIALPRIHRREREAVVHVLGIIAFSLVGVALQAKFFVYHFAAVYPLTGLLAGWGYWKLWLRVRHSMLLAFAAVLVSLAVPFGVIPDVSPADAFWGRSAKRIRTAFDTDERRVAVRDRLYSLGDVDARSNRAAAEFITANTDERSYLFIWGFEPAIYDLARRRPASRYIYNVPQRAAWSMQSSREVLMNDLADRPPAAIVVVHRDPLPKVAGNRADSFEALRGFSALRDLLANEYRSARRVGDIEIHLRIEDAR